MSKLKNNQKGLSSVLVVVLVLVAAGAVLVWYFMNSAAVNEEYEMTVNENEVVVEGEELEYDPETENTPEELDNEALQELDELIMGVDAPTEAEVDPVEL